MSEFSKLNGYDVKDKKAVRYYDTVASMKADTTIKEGQCVETLGYYNINDNGGCKYYITSTQNGLYYQEQLDNELYATLIIKDYVTPEMFGAYGDSIHDDITAFNNAINYSNKIILYSKSYLLSEQLVIPSGKELMGNASILGNTILNSAYGIKMAGKKITVKNIELVGVNQQNYGIYCCGDNEGGSTSGANHFNQNIIENIIINNYDKGIYFSGVIWNNTFDNIRINFCNYGLYNTSTYYIMTTVFNNVYFSGCLQYNAQLYKSTITFNSCNFGISSIHSLQFMSNCNIVIDNSNFECDKYIDGNGVLIEITGVNLTIRNSAFKICASSNMSIFNVGAAVRNLLLESNIYQSINLSSNNALTKVFSDQISGPIFGNINIKEGNDSIPFNIETESGRLSYSKYPYVRWHNLIQAYSEVSDLTKLNKGDMIYFYQTNTIKYYNGTELVDM